MNTSQYTFGIQFALFGRDRIVAADLSMPIEPRPVEADKGLGRNCLYGGNAVGHRSTNCTAKGCY